ncbi:MAG: GTPase Era [Clostridiaceae bacterium]|nr:GTPase Era [Eubacteriales bacterium]
MMEGYRSGFVSIVGSPNVGKSTLLNRMVGQKVSIVSERAQTTRNRVMGVLTRPGFQIVFLDTPGVTTPKNRLGEYMLKVAYDALDEVEAILFLVDASRGVGPRDELLIERLKTAKPPVIAAVNKIDLVSLGDADEAEEKLRAAEAFADVLRVSAVEGRGLDALEKKLFSFLEEGPQYFPDDMVTDQPERVLAAELIRERALKLLKEEVPHGIGVGIDKMARREGMELMDVWATIYCEREGHKGILIGKGGSMLKRIGTEARHEIELMLGERVNLQLWVKVREDWRNSVSAMREFGYEP